MRSIGNAGSDGDSPREPETSCWLAGDGRTRCVALTGQCRPVAISSFPWFIVQVKSVTASRISTRPGTWAIRVTENLQTIRRCAMYVSEPPRQFFYRWSMTRTRRRGNERGKRRSEGLLYSVCPGLSTFCIEERYKHEMRNWR